MSLPLHNVHSTTLFYDITECFNKYNLIFVKTFSNNSFIESLIFSVEYRSILRTILEVEKLRKT